MPELKPMKCKNCGEPLDPQKASDGVLKCEVCGAIWTLPKVDSAALAFLRQGEHDLDTCKFEDAHAAYEKAAQLDPGEPEAYFGMALSEFRVQYLKDEVNGRLQPICHEISEKVFTEDKNYKKALELATPEQKKVYRRKGGEIDDIRNEFFALKKSGLDYDCFLCVKVTEEDGSRTRDYDRANEIYYHLKDKGYQPFFSERELKGRSGSNYEALILYALYTSECMLIVCSDEGHLQTKWVKNEYTRFLSMIANEEKERDAVTFAFYGKPIERLPGRNGKLQGIDLTKPDAYSRITEYVENHTPEAKEKREKAAREKQEAEAARDKAAKEQTKQPLESNPSAEEPEKKPQLDPYYPTLDNYNQDDFEIEGTVLKKFKNKSFSGEVKIPRGVTSIGEFAFIGCSNLTTVVIPDSMTAIGDAAFGNCGSLTSIVIPNSVTSIGKLAFSDCKNLKNIVIPKGVTSIGFAAFRRCENLTNIVISHGVTEIGDRAFGACKSLKSLIIPKSVKKISDNPCSNCSSLEKIEVESGNPAYYSKDNCIIEAKSKTLVACCNNSVIPSDGSVSIIGTDAFCGYVSLETVVIPQSVKTIKSFAFRNCEKLKRIVIPKNVKEIGVGAFADCLSLEKIKVASGNPAYHSKSNCIIETESKTLIAGCKNSVIPKGVTSIGWGAFEGCQSLTSIVLPKGVTEIRTGAFSDCENLTSIVIPKGVTSIEFSAFGCCQSLTSIVIPESVTSIGSDAFHGCKSLTSIVIPKGVTEIGLFAFRDCNNLTIYCEAEEQPSGWHESWNRDNRPVVWGYKK